MSKRVLLSALPGRDQLGCDTEAASGLRLARRANATLRAAAPLLRYLANVEHRLVRGGPPCVRGGLGDRLPGRGSR